MDWSLLCEKEIWPVKWKISINFIGRYLMISRDSVGSAGIHHNSSSLNIGIKENFWIFDGTVNVRLGSKVNNDIRVLRFKNFIDNGNQEIKKAIATLNDNLKKIPYGDNPKTFLQLKIADSRDQKIVEFNRMLKNAIPNAAGYESDDEEEKAFRRIKDFIDFVRENERNRKFILDLRNWHSFAATELKYEDETETHYYSDSNSLSGGEKAKLTYTILASAIAYQFGINESTSRSLRFVIVDEVFSKSDSINAQYAMQLFKQLDLQVMIVTPLDKLNIAEEYISSVHQVQKTGDASRVLSLTMERFRERRAELESK